MKLEDAQIIAKDDIVITVKNKGSWSKTFKFLDNCSNFDPAVILKKYAEEGVRALSEATPKDTGETADSWYYNIKKTENGYEIEWLNSKMIGSVPLVILLQLGHGTGTGGYIRGTDFINPALESIFNKIADSAWREVTR